MMIIDYSSIYNFFKYSSTIYNLEDSGFSQTKITESYNIFEKTDDKYNYKIIFIGGYRSVQDNADCEFWDRLFGAPIKKEFVPESIKLILNTFIIDKEMEGVVRSQEHNLHLNFNIEYLVKIDALRSGVNFVNIINDYIDQLIRKLHTKYPENKYQFINSERNVYNNPRINYEESCFQCIRQS